MSARYQVSTGIVQESEKRVVLKERLAFMGTWEEGGRYIGLGCERFYLTVAGRRCTEDTEHWEERKALRQR